MRHKHGSMRVVGSEVLNLGPSSASQVGLANVGTSVAGDDGEDFDQPGSDHLRLPEPVHQSAAHLEVD